MTTKLQLKNVKVSFLTGLQACDVVRVSELGCVMSGYTYNEVKGTCLVVTKHVLFKASNF